MKQRKFICFENELKDSDRMSASFTVNGKDIWVFKSNGVIMAFGNCPHMNAPLKKAKVCGTYIICTAHGNMFDFATGKNDGHIPCGNLPTFDLEIVNGEVYVLTDDMVITMETV